MNEISGELSEISDQLSDITEIISDIGTDESDVDTEEDIQPAPGRNAYPWFSVIDRETFQLSVEGFVAGKHWTYGIWTKLYCPYNILKNVYQPKMKTWYVVWLTKQTGISTIKYNMQARL